MNQTKRSAQNIEDLPEQELQRRFSDLSPSFLQINVVQRQNSLSSYHTAETDGNTHAPAESSFGSGWGTEREIKCTSVTNWSPQFPMSSKGTAFVLISKLNWTVLLAFPLYITWLQIPPPLTRSSVHQLHVLLPFSFSSGYGGCGKNPLCWDLQIPNSPELRLKERPPTHVSTEASLHISNQATESFLSLVFCGIMNVFCQPGFGAR